MKTIYIKTKRLILRPMSELELTEYITNIDNAELKQAYTEMLEGTRNDPQNWMWYTAWKMTLKKEQSIIVGDLCFKGPQKNGGVEIGYGMNPEYEGQGYMTEAAQALISWAFSQKDVYVIFAETEPGNAASQRVLEKLKFSPCGVGTEGPRFRIEKPQSAWTSIYMCFGLSIGMSVGISLGNMSYGMCMGIPIGMLIGISLDRQEKKHRANIIGESEE